MSDCSSSSVITSGGVVQTSINKVYIWVCPEESLELFLSAEKGDGIVGVKIKNSQNATQELAIDTSVQYMQLMSLGEWQKHGQKQKLGRGSPKNRGWQKCR